MKINKKALELTKKFAAGAPCKIDLNNIENTMFWPHYEVIAKNLDLKEITERVVEKYWFEIHNVIVSKRFKKGDLNLEEAKHCMVRPLKTDKGWVAVHGKATAMSITKQEAEFLKKKNQNLLKSL